MKFLSAIIGLLLFIWVPLKAQQTEISGQVLDEGSGKPLPGIEVMAGQYTSVTTSEGIFKLTGLKNGIYTLTFTGEGYESLSLEINLEKQKSDLGQIKLKNVGTQLETGITEISLADDENSSDQGVSGVLHSTADPFVSAASYSFSPMFFKTRGYDQEYQPVYMNGIPVNDAETGRAVWNEWGGLNDVTRNKEVVNGLEPAAFTLGNIGGATQINSRPSMQRKQTKLSYSLANKSYNNRIMFTYSTGLMSNDWAFTVSGSRRWSQEGYVEGTYYDAYSLFAGAEKKINNRHSIALVAYASPYSRAAMGPATQEVLDLSGNHYYNPNWGMQNGEKRNARVKSAFEPMIILNHYFTLSDKTKITNNIAFSFGRLDYTNLNWYNSPDPRPDYYQYLPSYFSETPDVANAIAERWKNDVSYSQINWNRLYQVNYLSNAVGEQARYIVESNVTKQNQIYLTSNIRHITGEHGELDGGIEFSHYKGTHYKEMVDLLGGEYWVDIDQFAERDFDADSIKLQNDLDNPNRKIKEGDIFGYHYILTQTTASAWILKSWKYNHFDYYAGGSFNFTSIAREGKMRNGRSPDNSLGKSDPLNFAGVNLKAGATYKISGRQYVALNAARLTIPANLRDVYLSPRNGNVDNVSDGSMFDVTKRGGNELVYSADLSYIVRYPKLNARFTVYDTYFQNHSEVMRFYHDDYHTYMNMLLSNQNRIHQGIEAGALVTLTSWLKASAACNIGNYRYTNRPTALLNADNGLIPDTTYTVFIKNFFVSGTPQFASNFSLKINKNFWFIDVTANYFDKIYLSFNPERRTQRAVLNLGEGDPLIKSITEQTKFDGGMTLDASIGKSIRYKGYFITLNLTVNNILNNTNLVSGGFEQLRFDFETKDVSNFPPKIFYSYGTTFFFNVGIRL